jgi:hypothetical protein
MRSWDSCSVNELATPSTSMSQKPDKDPKSLKDFKYTKLHELFEMTETHQLFDIWGSYVEIDGWVSFHFSSNATVSRMVAVSHDSRTMNTRLPKTELY